MTLKSCFPLRSGYGNDTVLQSRSVLCLYQELDQLTVLAHFYCTTKTFLPFPLRTLLQSSIMNLKGLGHGVKKHWAKFSVGVVLLSKEVDVQHLRTSSLKMDWKQRLNPKPIVESDSFVFKGIWASFHVLHMFIVMYMSLCMRICFHTLFNSLGHFCDSEGIVILPGQQSSNSNVSYNSSVMVIWVEKLTSPWRHLNNNEKN